MRVFRYRGFRYIGILLILALGVWWMWRAHFNGVEAKVEPGRLVRVAEGQRGFVLSHGFNPTICFLLDMGLPSGKDRFFVFDLQKDSVLFAGLVAHGAGKSKFASDPSFSNADGSGCTSLGRYRVGSPYQGRFGRAYKLYGLDSTNSNAFARSVVLHSYGWVPDHETYPVPICNSLGCAMVSPVFLKTLQPLIDGSSKPICLYIFN
jgi:hypothetical protein